MVTGYNTDLSPNPQLTTMAAKTHDISHAKRVIYVIRQSALDVTWDSTSTRYAMMMSRLPVDPESTGYKKQPVSASASHHCAIARDNVPATSRIALARPRMIPQGAAVILDPSSC